ncbi:MAG: hypothetical protein GF353_05805 [Candidatus Lokiarchaeota archaeon]|nr:hypothetical protein [Candidatus Lokiarchaeota archaeon]
MQISRSKNLFIFFLLLISFSISNLTLAAIKTQVIITNGATEAFRNKVGKNLSACINKLNVIAENPTKELKTCDVAEFCTFNGREKLVKLFNQARFYTYKKKIETSLIRLKTISGYEVRNIDIRVKLGNTEIDPDEDELENIVFIVDNEGKIEDVRSAMRRDAYDYIFNYGLEIENQERILKFLEDYRTYYINKEIEKIEKVFDDSARIIVGLRLKSVDDNLVKIKGKKKHKYYFEYIEKTKQEYIEKLKEVMKLNSFIKVSFDDITMKKIKGKEIYGITLLQSWHAEKYSDIGYLFIIIHCDNPQPIIFFRAFQDSLRIDEPMIDIEDFEIIN